MQEVINLIMTLSLFGGLCVLALIMHKVLDNTKKMRERLSRRYERNIQRRSKDEEYKKLTGEVGEDGYDL